jgi:hypothetical protein
MSETEEYLARSDVHIIIRIGHLLSSSLSHEEFVRLGEQLLEKTPPETL